MNSIPSRRDASNGPDVKTKFLSLVLFAAAVPTAMFAADAKSSITAIRCLTAEPKTGLPCEFGIDLAASYDDPFNPDEISVDAKVETPSRTYTVPCFFNEPFTRNASGIASAGAPSWRLRILPLENGVHRATSQTHPPTTYFVDSQSGRDSDTPAGIVVKVACTTGGTATNHVQVWGPSMPVNRGTHLQHGRHVGHRDQVQRLLRSHRMGQPLLERLENLAHAGRQPLVQRPWRDGKLVRHEDRQLRGVSREDRTRRPLALRPAEIRRRSPRRLPPCPPTAPARAWAPGTPRSASIGSPPTDPQFRSSIRPRITQIQKITENPSRPNPRRIQFPSSKLFAVMQFPSNDTLKVPPCIP